MSSDEITLDRIEKARRTISTTIHPTPIIQSTSLSQMCDASIFLKLEHQQLTGSFKLRGATNAILSLNNNQKSRGVVGLSTGNHGRGLAYSARLNGVKCIICMSSLVPKNKIDGIKAQGAEVRIIGDNQDDAQEDKTAKKKDNSKNDAVVNYFRDTLGSLVQDVKISKKKSDKYLHFELKQKRLIDKFLHHCDRAEK